MILVENSPFVPSTDSTEFVSSHQSQCISHIDSLTNPTETFLDLEDIDRLLSNETTYPSGTGGEYFYNLNEDEDEDFLELDLSNCSSSDQQEDDLNSVTPSVQRLFCQTSMSNYSSGSSGIEDIRLSESQKAIQSAISGKPAYIFGAAFDHGSSCGSGSSASSTPSTPSSTIGAFSNLAQSGITASTTLPSFNEIYSPRCFKANHNQIAYSGDFFKFDEYLSEGDSVSECELEQKPLLALSQQLPTQPMEGQDLFQPQIILKEEPLDSLIQSSNSNSSSCQTGGGPNTLNKYLDPFQMQPNLLPKSMTNFPQDTPVTKMELEQTTNQFKIQYQLHQIALNAFGNACESAQFEENFDSMSSELVEQQRIENTFDSETLTSQTLTMEPMTDAVNSMESPGSKFASENNHSKGHFQTRANKLRHQRKPAQMQICAVCGDVAACQHYGVLTCEGCKGFFKRTVQKGSKYTCLANKDCTVDKRRRNRCQFCRFQKCLAVGMDKEVVRTDNLKGRRGRLPSKPKEAAQVLPMSTIATLVRAHTETTSVKANFDFSQFDELNNISNTLVDRHFVDNMMLTMLNASLDNLYEFVEKIPGFNELCEHDRHLLFQKSCLELFALRLAYKFIVDQFQPGSECMVMYSNVVLHKSQFATTFGEWLSMIEELSRQLSNLEIDLSAFVCLCALTVISGRHGVQETRKIEQIEMKIIKALKDHTEYNSEAQKKPNYFSRILAKLSELRNVGVLGNRIVLSKLRVASNLSGGNMPEAIKELRSKLTSTNYTGECYKPVFDCLTDSQSRDLSSIPPFFHGIGSRCTS